MQAGSRRSRRRPRPTTARPPRSGRVRRCGRDSSVGVVGDEEVEVAVAVVVEGARAKPKPSASSRRPGGLGLVDVAAAGVELEVVVGRALNPKGPKATCSWALPVERAPRGEHVRLAAVDVGGHVEVEIAVAVGVEEGRARVPARRDEADLRRDVGEAPVAAVAEELQTRSS
jgi:hypothetical protein